MSVFEVLGITIVFGLIANTLVSMIKDTQHMRRMRKEMEERQQIHNQAIERLSRTQTELQQIESSRRQVEMYQEAMNRAVQSGQQVWIQQSDVQVETPPQNYRTPGVYTTTQGIALTDISLVSDTPLTPPPADKTAKMEVEKEKVE